MGRTDVFTESGDTIYLGVRDARYSDSHFKIFKICIWARCLFQDTQILISARYSNIHFKTFRPSRYISRYSFNLDIQIFILTNSFGSNVNVLKQHVIPRHTVSI